MMRHKFLLTDTQALRLRKTFANGSSSNVKLSETQLFKMLQFIGFLLLPLILPVTFKIGEEVVKRKTSTLAKNVVKQLVNKRIDELSKTFRGSRSNTSNIYNT